jgi:PhnB protein
MSEVPWKPEGFSVLSAHLTVDNATEAIEFYKKAFGAQELFRMPTPDGSLIMHCEMQVGDSRLMLCDEMPEGGTWRSPKSLGGTSVTVHLWTEDCDAAFQRALDAGATETMPLMDAFWGDRYGKVTDPYGHEWAIATHIKDMSPAEIVVAALDVFSGDE